MRQFETAELIFNGQAPEESQARIDLKAKIVRNGETKEIKGFYAGNNVYKIRFLPEEAGTYEYSVIGCISGKGSIEVEPANDSHHGIVRVDGTCFKYADGEIFHPFGTTVYALIHQTPELIGKTMHALKQAPFNKVRVCVFPKDYDYNKNEPQFYPFEKDSEGKWDVDHPCFDYWDALETHLKELENMQIQADLILFHPYDRWGFDSMSMEENFTYLEYLLRRLSAFPNIWWSLANEYDVCSKTMEEWEKIESYVAANDPFGHLLSCHNIFKFWDFTRPEVTHVSVQTKQLNKVGSWIEKYGKPVVVDECCYEGNVPQPWGSISGKEMTARFWRTVVLGGYCTHGETFLDDENEIIWWSKGGTLIGESPARIAFLKEIIEGLPGHLEGCVSPFEAIINIPSQMRGKMTEKMGSMKKFVEAFWRLGDKMEEYAQMEMLYKGHIGEKCYLNYYDIRTCARDILQLPEDKKYRVEIIDTWNMTRETAAEGVSGEVEINLPGREYMAVLAISES